ncbi:NAD-dependent epimerase/dehydratase family protein [Tateyamaria omphalii]|uniref:NAD-dependent epimerase/dehydratase family protein n=1 Tax=Tateyamaria omphalii TaxID=299262 RepID=UPI001C99E8BD|nr:NAD-dependent epimerase/dehydratase family protein [Tateyamaria omphalii]MBY5933250.1 NAD-dependent epimerase/dehydratase family protein [Tateyamaria omphalii]
MRGQNVLVIGGDGFCGWPTALRLSSLGYDVTIVDDFSRRKIADALGADSLTPIADLHTRLDTWEQVTGRRISFERIDIARQYDALKDCIERLWPDAVIHFGEQRAAPYSMRGTSEKRYTVSNNIRGTHNLLCAIAALRIDTHVVHLGTMGVYGYDGDGLEIPEGYLPIKVEADDGRLFDRDILYPTNPGSVYHMTKSMDQLMFQFYARNDGIRITDLHQGIVWGTQTDETRMDERLSNRFDYDGDYGTVLNRFLMQAAIGHPLTVHGTGGQTRAFINIADTVNCITLALENPPERGDKVCIRNQMTETHRVRDLAQIVARITGSTVEMVSNPRKEAAENDLRVSNKSFLDDGLKPITLEDGLLHESVSIAKKYQHRCDPAQIPARSTWTPEQQPGTIGSDPMKGVA